ncbi:MAG TPA: hypothetical protein DEP84_18955 [Chloroflexi bacterium]|nr:hypothetical protein [Chloroflexota bacterium]
MDTPPSSDPGVSSDPIRARRLGCLLSLPAALVALLGVVLIWWSRSVFSLLVYAAFLPLFMLGQGLATWLTGRIEVPAFLSGPPTVLEGAAARRWAVALLVSGLILLLLCGGLWWDMWRVLHSS